MKKLMALGLVLICISTLIVSFSSCSWREKAHWGASVRVWDSKHPDDSYASRYFSITVAELNDAKIECRPPRSEVYVNDERLLYGLTSLYLSDLTNDGYPELCFCISTGSGIINYSVVIYDLQNEAWVYGITDRQNKDYFLFLRNGVLCIKETEFSKDEPVRTGGFVYNNSELSIAWDSEVNASVDRGPAYAP